NIACTGQAGALPRLKGFSAFKRFLPLAFSRQLPRLPVTPAVRMQGFPNFWNSWKYCDVVSPAMARYEDGVLSMMARYNEGVLQAMARDESGVLPIKVCPLPSLVRRLEADPDPACILTKRAADGGDSARLTGIFSARTFFCSWSFVSSRPAAANANRCAASSRTVTSLHIGRLVYEAQNRSHLGTRFSASLSIQSKSQTFVCSSAP
ncbi:MAG: hypothetical protein AB1516_15120, partial [Pseudomonadota bacterium]